MRTETRLRCALVAACLLVAALAATARPTNTSAAFLKRASRQHVSLAEIEAARVDNVRAAPDAADSPYANFFINNVEVGTLFWAKPGPGPDKRTAGGHRRATAFFFVLFDFIFVFFFVFVSFFRSSPIPRNARLGRSHHTTLPLSHAPPLPHSRVQPSGLPRSYFVPEGYYDSIPSGLQPDEFDGEPGGAGGAVVGIALCMVGGGVGESEPCPLPLPRTCMHFTPCPCPFRSQARCTWSTAAARCRPTQ